MTYDPRVHGARCGECVLAELRDGQPVPPENSGHARLAVIAEAPGKDEVMMGRPLIGRSGQLEMEVLHRHGLSRTDVHWTNGCLCRPPDNNFDLVLASVRGRNAAIRRRNYHVKQNNKLRKQQGLEPLPLERELPTPMEACRPRLLNELRQHGITCAIALGKVAMQALDPHHTAGILKVRGAPTSFSWKTGPDGMPHLERVPPAPPDPSPLSIGTTRPASTAHQVHGDLLVLPTVHPAFILRSGRWRNAFDVDHGRAMRLFDKKLTWRDPKMVFNPTVGALQELLGVEWRAAPPPGAQGVLWPLGPATAAEPWKASVPNGWVPATYGGRQGGWWCNPAKARPLAYDWETDALEPLDCVARCVQIGDLAEVLTPFFASVEPGRESYYDPDTFQAVIDIVRAWATGATWKYGHNSGYYDQLVFMAYMGVRVRYGRDQILDHRLIEGELQHNLRYLASIGADIHNWKEGDPGVNARSDRVLGVYGCLDTALTYGTATGWVFPQVAATQQGGFAVPGLETRLLKEPTRQIVRRDDDGKAIGFAAAPVEVPPRGGNWWWTNVDPGIPCGQPTPTFVVNDPGAPNQLDSANQPGLVAFNPGLATPATRVQAQALAEANAPVVREGLVGLTALDHAIQDPGAVGMHAIGMYVDQPTRLAFLRKQSAKLREAREEVTRVVTEATGRSDWGSNPRKEQAFNPASVYHLRKLFYDAWDLPILARSKKTNAPSTGDSAMRKLLALKSLPSEARDAILALRRFRKAHKIVGTYLLPMGLRSPADRVAARPAQGWGQRWAEAWESDAAIEHDGQHASFGELDWDDHADADALAAMEIPDAELTEDQFNARYLMAEVGRSKLRVNGRVHPDWKAHTAVTGRLSSSPNLQNIIRWLRSMFLPASLEWLIQDVERMRRSPNELRTWASFGVDLRRFTPTEGHSFVYADSDQLELRIAASRWKAIRYLEAFATSAVFDGKREWMDPHQITMHAIWGDMIWSLPGAPALKCERFYKKFAKNSEFDRLRDLGKRVLYASQYGAQPPTVHDVITSAENKKGELLYKDLSLAEVRVMQQNLLRNMPEFKRGWAWEIATLKAQGFLSEPVTGRRFYCLDGYDDLSLVVNRPIQSSGAAIIALATAEMLQKYPIGFGGPYTGLANHCHDAMTWEVPTSRAEEVAADLTDAMTRVVAAYPDVRFIGEAEVCSKWQ